MKNLVLMITKNILRHKLRTSQNATQDTPLAITQNLQNIINHFISCQTIGLYIPMSYEPDLLHLIAQNPSKTFALPKVVGNNEMVFAQYELSNSLKRNDKLPLIHEPIENKILSPDLLIVPGIAFDIRGYRLGLGKGHYDRYLSKNNNIKTIGVCFSQNLLQRLPTEDHDCKMDYIVTEHSIIKT